MESQSQSRQSLNSTRLSLALNDLPLTPFGMKSMKPMSKWFLGGSPSSKLSRQKNSPHKTPSQIDAGGNGNAFPNRKLNERSIKYVLDKHNSKNANSHGSLGNMKCLTTPYHKRDSVFSDVDDGSFVEFIQKSDEKLIETEKLETIYYTSSENNETQYSTSSKHPSAEVGFRKFVNAVSFEKLNEIQEEEEYNSLGSRGRPHFVDEIVLRGNDALLHKSQMKLTSDIFNSTAKTGNAVPKLYPDISSLTLETSDKCSSIDEMSNPQQNKIDNTCIVVSDSSESDYETTNYITKRNHPTKSFLSPLCSKSKLNYLNSKELSKDESDDSLFTEDVDISSSGFKVLCAESPENRVKDYTKHSPYKAPVDFRPKTAVPPDDISIKPSVLKWVMNNPLAHGSFSSSFMNDKGLTPSRKTSNDGKSSQKLLLRFSESSYSESQKLTESSSEESVYTISRVAISPSERNPRSDVKHSPAPQNIALTAPKSPNFVSSFPHHQPIEVSKTYVEESSIKLSQKKFTSPISSFPKQKGFYSPISRSKNDSGINNSNNKMPAHGSTSDAESSQSSESHSNLLINIFSIKNRMQKFKPNVIYSSDDSESSITQAEENGSIPETVLRKDLNFQKLSREFDLLMNKTGKNNQSEVQRPSGVPERSDGSSNGEVLTKSNEPNRQICTKQLKLNRPLIFSSDNEDSFSDAPNNDIDRLHKSEVVLHRDLNYDTNPKKIELSNLQKLRREFDLLLNNAGKNRKSDCLRPSIPESESSDSEEVLTKNYKRKVYGKKLRANRPLIMSSDDEDSFSDAPNIDKLHKFGNVENESSSHWRNPVVVVLSSSEDDGTPCPDQKGQFLNQISSDSEPLPDLPLSSKDFKIQRYLTPRKPKKNKTLIKQRNAPNIVTSQPGLSLLSSLTTGCDLNHCHPRALPFLRNFKKHKAELTDLLYSYFNGHIFDQKLPVTMDIKWNVRMTKTAGFCYFQINKSAGCGRGARIELSPKVIDSPERLRDTLIHELCHAAAWIISAYKGGHGRQWKYWASHTRKVFPELPSISRCHSYEISCKYTYRCTKCGYSIGRHSKSLDTNRKVCGYCHSKFELHVEKSAAGPQTPAGGGAAPPPKTPRTPGPFAIFVKENYGSVKKSKKDLRHAEVMRELSEMFGRMKSGE